MILQVGAPVFYGSGDLLLSVGTDHFVPRRFVVDPFSDGMRVSMEKFHYLAVKNITQSVGNLDL